MQGVFHQVGDPPDRPSRTQRRWGAIGAIQRLPQVPLALLQLRQRGPDFGKFVCKSLSVHHSLRCMVCSAPACAEGVNDSLPRDAFDLHI